ncbi:hypothetical protein [Pilimelia columellifera]|uniref:Uncharacterized protein n=1 Tax=Pilimelia columellifera subsp. columellifera TaxID=706583 RepID=A0ABP6AVX9_9ACTN
MASERVNLTMESAALTAARSAAAQAGTSLSEWMSRAAWDRAVAQAARISAEQDRQLGGELPGWDDDGADRVFGDAA